MTNKLLTPDQIAAKLNVSGVSVRLWIRQGKIAYQKIGGRYYIPESVVDELLKIHNPK